MLSVMNSHFQKKFSGNKIKSDKHNGLTATRNFL